MAIEKNTFKVARFDPEYHSLHSMDKCISSDDEDLHRPNSTSVVELEDDDDDEFDDCDSGAGSDDFDLLELGDSGEEFCQIGDQTCSIPYELYDLPGLEHLLSMEVWNECLTEGERLDLARYLPDMDQENFVLTLKELFTGDNLHFGSPLDKLFGMLKGGLCEPRVALYRQGWNFFQRRQHYHNLRKHHNAMLSNLCQTRDAWLNYRGYSIEEKLRLLNIIKNQKSLMTENMEELRGESSDREESGNDLWGAKANGGDIGRYSCYSTGPTLDISSRVRKTSTAPAKHGKQNSRGNLKLSGQKNTTPKELAETVTPTHKRIEMKSGHFGSVIPVSVYKGAGNNYSAAVKSTEQMIEDDEEENIYEVAVHRDRNSPGVGAIDKPGASKFWKKRERRGAQEDVDSFTGVPIQVRNDLHALGRNKAINQLSDIKVLTAKPSTARNLHDEGKRMYYAEYIQQLPNLSLKRSQAAFLVGSDPTGMSKQHDGLFPPDLSYKPSHLNAKNKKSKMGNEAIESSENNKFMHAEYRRPKSLKGKFRASSLHSGKGTVGNAIRTSAKSEETESDSSEQMDDNEDDNPLMRSKWAYPNTMADLRYGLHAKKAKLSERDKKDGHLNLDGSSHSSRKIEGFRIDLEMMKAEQKGKMHDLGYMNILPTNGLDKNYFTEYKLQDDLFLTRQLAADNEIPYGLGRKDQMMDLSSGHHPERSDVPLEGHDSILKKRKTKHLSDNNDYLHAQLQNDNMASLRKHGNNKFEDVTDSVQKGSEPPMVELEMEDVVAEAKIQKKSFPLITPTVLSGFSFSIIHLLSAVRIAMTTLLPEDKEARKHIDKNVAGQGVEEERCSKQEDTTMVSSSSNMDINTSTPCDEATVPSLTVQEIVNRVKSNPGDPCILETQEPLQDLVRGALKIFASRTAPLGAKGWKPLVIYDKSSKVWSWIGPVSRDISNSEAVEEVTSPDSWGLPNRMLVKLVDSFANWLKNSQDALQQIGSLPSPPLELVQINLDEKERFKDMRAQKSLSTISQSSEEVKAYFRKEEALRYLIPDRAFSYTAVDGKKSIVAPLRRCGGKPTSKARDHFMLKRSRPPHVTILCLVRDAAARLPGSIGTRADVCTLIRDSQYIVEDVSDAQVNQVVSGALDRLHYERDPCVQFDGERKLWVYLHREREEEDFEDDGTSSTKKWRRQKKEATEPSEQGDDTVAYSEPVEQLGFDLVSDLNVEASYGDNDHKKSAPDYHNNGNDEVEDNAETSHGSDPGVPNVPVWNNLGLNNIEEHKLLGEENSTNEDIDDETFCGEPPA